MKLDFSLETRIRVLLVEDNVDDIYLSKELVARSGSLAVEWTNASSVADAIRSLADEEFDAVLLDLALPDSRGLETVSSLVAVTETVPIVVLTGEAEESLGQKAIGIGAQDYLVKWPKDGQTIVRALRYAIERKRAIEKLRASEARYRSLIQTAGSVILSLSSDGRILECNQAAEQVFCWNRDEMLGQNFFSTCLAEEVAARVRGEFRKVQREGSNRGLEFAVRTRGGEERVLLWNVTWLPGEKTSEGSLIAVGQDITEQKKIESQLRQAQKMEAIGRLAGGVAHDFNNLLTVITGYTQIAMDRLPTDDPVVECLREVDIAAERAASLTQQLLIFSRKQIRQPTILDLNTLIRDSVKMLGRLIGEDIELITRLDPVPAPVKADPNELQQLIMNLAVNSRDAMPTGGQFVLETKNVHCDKADVLSHPEMPPGTYVLLTVADTGYGMDEATLSRIFDPFFTTKDVGKGTGLGLAIVYGIVKESDGFIYVSSRRGAGTTFRIYLPRHGGLAKATCSADSVLAIPESSSVGSSENANH
ncbi:MAG: histidine kinase [Gemmatales bacterium]|nr:MAG: histidine kinase [Gemmatales bacterium]